MKIKLLFPLALATLASLSLRAETTPPDDGLFISLNRNAEDPKRLPTNVSALTAEDIRREKPATLEDALSKLPGVQVQRSGPLGTFSTLRLRGVPSSSQVLILVDHVPFGGVGSQFSDLSQIPIETIIRVEIVRGGASALYGANAVGGVVNIITKKAKEEGARTTLKGEVRSLGTQLYQGDFGVKAGPLEGYVNAGRYLADGFQKNQDSDHIFGSGKVGFTLGSGARIGFSADRTDHEVGNPSGTPERIGQWDGHKERAANDETARVEKDATRLRLTADVPVGNYLWQTSAFGFVERNLNTKSAYPGVEDSSRRKTITGGDTQFAYGRHFVLGASLERDERKNETGNDPAIRDHVVNTGAYGQATFTAGKWNFLPAVRYDHHSAFGGELNPRFTVVFRPEEKLKLSANISRSYRAPDMSALYDNFPAFYGFNKTVANPHVKPEIGWTYDAGVERRLGQKAFVRATGFYTHLTDRIYSTSNMAPSVEDNTTLNGPKAEITGAEVESSVGFSMGQLLAQYTYLRALGNSPDASTFRPLRMTPRHSASAELAVDLPEKWVLLNTVRYLHKQYTTDGETTNPYSDTKLPSFTLWGIRLTKTVLAADFYFGVDNITNKHYTESAFFDPMPGRTFGVGVNMRFID